MDTNYDEWSDLQVVTEVAKRRGLLVMPEDGSGYSHDYRAKYPSTIWAAKHEFGNQIEPWEQFNCIKCPNDAWPIIVENNITIELSPDCTFEAYTRFNGKRYGVIFSDKRASLRAAMICFLKLVDDSND
ncbi:NinX [Vibrio phage 1.118.B._10N.261.49.F6]|nr:NinX [Vibrio phage 1.118.A._10N.261.49.F6]AUR88875.1 NinX [Vibrio phage 1.118.B._10N.261.49.F6]AUR91369.1 NinX [Vibrio phage 1.160.O._10N.261.48.B11]AUR97079.1 NinX [Vibrio phage 1.237.A._10N.261.52.C5]AUR97174.1 NinX [Vibrio phage 1.237.B._10N.261.52.C5]